MPDLLRLVAMDSEDLGVISANLQDALVRVGDMAYLPHSKRFAIVSSRFDWVKANQGVLERCRTGLHFERVFKVSCAGFSQRDKGAILNLLSISFKETEPPSGEVALIFSAGGALRLEVECLEAELRDLGLRWKAGCLPGHPLENAEGAPK
nr:DUF2948 family protein [Methylocapsa aurea]